MIFLCGILDGFSMWNSRGFSKRIPLLMLSLFFPLKRREFVVTKGPSKWGLRLCPHTCPPCPALLPFLPTRPPAMPCPVESRAHYITVRIFLFQSEVAESHIFSRLNSEIYLDHSEIFLVSIFDFGIFPKLSIVSWIFYIFNKIKSLLCF